MKKAFPFLLPVAILLAGGILAFAVYTVRVQERVPTQEITTSLIRPLQEDDHIIGSPDSEVVLITYSDIDCEYCKEFQATLSQLMSEYAPEGRVAWVYRHFPITSIHKHSGTHAKASECVASVAGESYFFRFIDALHQQSPGTAEFNPLKYPEVLASLGVNETAFTTCMNEDLFAEKVAVDAENAVLVGATGAPYTVILIKGNEPLPISGSLPYYSMKQVIEEALSLVRQEI